MSQAPLGIHPGDNNHSELKKNQRVSALLTRDPGKADGFYWRTPPEGNWR